MRLHYAIWLALVLALCWSPPVAAQTAGAAAAPAAPPAAEKREAAREAYNKGKAAVSKADFETAHKQFKWAHELIPTPHTQYWIAFCLDAQGKDAEAIAEYEKFLSDPAKDKAGKDKVETAQTRLSELKAEAAKPADQKEAKKGEKPEKPKAPPPAAAKDDVDPYGALAEDDKPEMEIPLDGSTYSVRMRDLEQRIDRLQEQVRRGHMRLSLLSETVLGGGVGGARARIEFENHLTSAFQVTRVLFVLDGAVQYNKQDSAGKLSDVREIPIFHGSVTPGEHTLQVLLKMRGSGYGVFSYLRGYKFDVKSSHTFTLEKGEAVHLKVLAWEKGDVTTPIEQRPAIRYIDKDDQDVRGEGERPGAPANEKPGFSKSLSVGTDDKKSE